MEEKLLWIMDFGFWSYRSNILKTDLFLTNMRLFTLAAVWTLILSAPIHLYGQTFFIFG